MGTDIVVWHGTRRRGLEEARAGGFALRDPVATAEHIAGTLGLSVAEITARPEYGDALGSLALVDKVLSVTDQRALADEYARTGSGTVSDILGAAYVLLCERGKRVPPFGAFLVEWLEEHDPGPVVIEFVVPAGELVPVADREYGLPLAQAREHAEWVRHADGTRERFVR